jgi:hypothetical protein
MDILLDRAPDSISSKSLYDFADMAMKRMPIDGGQVLSTAKYSLSDLKNYVPLGGSVIIKLGANKLVHITVPLTKKWMLF